LSAHRESAVEALKRHQVAAFVYHGDDGAGRIVLLCVVHRSRNRFLRAVQVERFFLNYLCIRVADNAISASALRILNEVFIMLFLLAPLKCRG
jgi:hypothetical protein